MNIVGKLVDRPGKQRGRALAAGLVISTLLHGTLLGGLLAAPLGLWLGRGSSGPPGNVIVVSRCAPSEPSPRADVRLVSDPSEVTGQMVDEKLSELIAKSQQRSDAENLERFQRFAQRLEEVSSEQSIDQLASAFQRWLGTTERASEPAGQPPAGPFDFDTAQLYAIRRQRTADGSWRYWSVLVDAEGRVLEVEMDQADGQRLYKLIGRLKAFPLAEKVYRQIAVPLLDKLVRASQEAARARQDHSGEPQSTSQSASSLPASSGP